LFWRQSYLIGAHGLAASALIVVLPIVVVLVLLGVLRRPAWMAALCGLGATLLVILFGYGMPLRIAFGAMSYGAVFGLLPVSWIVAGAILLYRTTEYTGKFAVIRRSIASLTKDAPMQALLIAFGFAAFLEGAAGFGTPVAIAAAMLTGLGFSPMRASAICLLANTAPVAFGSIGIPLVTLAGTTGLPLNHLSASVGALCAPLALLMPAYMLAAVGGRRVLRSAWVPALTVGAVFAIVQYGVAAYIGPQLADIAAAMVAMAALFLLCRRRTEGSAAFAAGEAFRGADLASAAVLPRDEEALTTSAVLSAWMPYGLLVLFILLWACRPLQHLLDRATVSFTWPWLHDRVLRVYPITASPQPYHAVFVLNILSAAGTACVAAWLSTAVACRLSVREVFGIVRAVCGQLLLPVTTIMIVMAMAFLMNYSGATATLGLALANTGRAFPFFSAMLGWLGVFLTGSDTSANALFGNLQVVTATRLHLDPVLMAAGMQTVEQSKLFRTMLKHSVLLAAVVGGIVLLYVRLGR
jgi:L-lactate transport